MAPQPTFSDSPGASQTPTTTQPPWHQTQERRPKEVKDKENETPVTSCENFNGLTGEKINVVNYYDSQTGGTTTIRKIEIPEQPRMGGSIPAKTIWEILIQLPGQPKKKITYDLEPGNETRTEKTGKDKPNTRKVAGDDMSTPEVKKSSLPSYLDGPVFVRTARRQAETSQPRHRTKLELAAAAPMPTLSTSSASSASSRPQGMSITMKSDARGEPPQLFFALSDFSPPMTADEYVLSQALQTLEYERQHPLESYYKDDVDNPGVFRPGDSFHTQDGQNIEIVGDWSLARVPGGFLMSCGGFDMDDEDDDGWRVPYDIRFQSVEKRIIKPPPL